MVVVLSVKSVGLSCPPSGTVSSEALMECIVALSAAKIRDR
jgi:hypothetical protein